MPRTAKNPNAKVYPCPHCDKVFQSVNSVYAHVRTKHPGRTYSTKMNIVPHNTTQPADTTRIKQLLVDLRMKFVDGEIEVNDYMAQKGILENSLTKVQQDWEDENTCKNSPTIDFKIFENVRGGDEPYIEVRKYIIEHGLFDKLKVLVDDLQYGKAFLLLFADNLNVTDDGKYDALGNLLYTASYMHDGTQKTLKDITTEDFWKMFNNFVMGMCYMVMPKIYPPSSLEKSSDNLTPDEEEKVELDLAEMEATRDWFTTTLSKTSDKNNEPVRKDLELVLNSFNKTLKI